MKDDLIERLERASGPDRELDERIDRWLHGISGNPGRILMPWGHQEFTKRLDSAVTVVPDGHAWGVFDEPSAWVWPDQKRDLLTGWQGKGATPAIALCIAAIKARGRVAERGMAR